MKAALITITLVYLSVAHADILDFKGKFAFTRDKAKEWPTNSSCMEIGSKVLKMLSKYKCFPFKDVGAPLMEAIGKCQKDPKVEAYIFPSKKSCEDALADMNDGDAT